MDIDCGDNSCRFATNRGGMRTNGGCRCFENAGFGPSAVGAALKMLPEITRLRAEVEKLTANFDDMRKQRDVLCDENDALRRVRDAAAQYRREQESPVKDCVMVVRRRVEMFAALDAAKDES